MSLIDMIGCIYDDFLWCECYLIGLIPACEPHDKHNVCVGFFFFLFLFSSSGLISRTILWQMEQQKGQVEKKRRVSCGLV